MGQGEASWKGMSLDEGRRGRKEVLGKRVGKSMDL
jgi:hypothetical protein